MNTRHSSQYQWNVKVPHPNFIMPIPVLLMLPLFGVVSMLAVMALREFPLALVPLVLVTVAVCDDMFRRVSANDKARLAHRQSIADAIADETGVTLKVGHFVAVARAVYGNPNHVEQDASRTYACGDGTDITVTMLADGRVSAVAR